MKLKMKNNTNFILIIFIIISLIELNHGYLVLPFKYRSPPKTSNLTELVYNLLENNIVVSLPFGEPKKNIDFYMSMNLYLYYLEEGSCLSDSSPTYYFDNSFSFSFYKNITFCSVKLDICALGKEKLYFYQDIDLKSTIEFSDFLFYYGHRKDNINKNNKQICGKLGFKLDNLPYHNYEYENFIRMMKQKGLINSYSWYIHYYKKPFGKELYDGAIILDIFSPKFFDDFSYLTYKIDYNTINSKDLEGILPWTFIFEKIYYNTFNDTKIEINNREVGLVLENNFILCPEGYFKSIQIKFFDYYFKNNICFLEKGRYTYIFCDKNKFINDKNNFPVLYFKSDKLNQIFTLDGNDLFQEYNNYFIFMILLKDFSYKLWTLGNIFMRKYNFYFDNDRKFIGCFGEKDNNDNNGFLELFDKIKWYLFVTIGIIIGFLIGKKLRDNVRKLRANELQDNYEYLENKAIIKDNNIVENNNISNYKEIKTQLYNMGKED